MYPQSITMSIFLFNSRISWDPNWKKPVLPKLILQFAVNGLNIAELQKAAFIQDYFQIDLAVKQCLSFFYQPKAIKVSNTLHVAMNCKQVKCWGDQHFHLLCVLWNWFNWLLKQCLVVVWLSDMFKYPRDCFRSGLFWLCSLGSD